ncbi:cobalamin biosynthesis protein [Rhodophyticola sp. CCM32]|uniref:cobalamin biosynthesis protein n=1 Tax=Rhodophyticola sp. CCM32 TaxID=2916397 RepID=UPI00107F448C|nr:cobalamin biosynthesis protein [Rhodophyticola sp. CCM32]QBY01678.1 cobalamin biosynthesis protein [Rhodophyticola sp. CCM32]
MIVAGFGFRAAATLASLEDALNRAGVGAQLFATVADKAVAPAMVTLAERHEVPVAGIQADVLEAQITLTRSQASQHNRNSGSVAEAAALAAAGPGARLLAARVVSADRMATCALAQGDQT